MYLDVHLPPACCFVSMVADIGLPLCSVEKCASYPAGPRRSGALRLFSSSVADTASRFKPVYFLEHVVRSRHRVSWRAAAGRFFIGRPPAGPQIVRQRLTWVSVVLYSASVAGASCLLACAGGWRNRARSAIGRAGRRLVRSVSVVRCSTGCRSVAALKSLSLKTTKSSNYNQGWCQGIL